MAEGSSSSSSSSSSLALESQGILDEIQSVFRQADALHACPLDSIVKEILECRRIFLHGVGREGLMMKGLAMRLFHLGLSSHCIGDMTTPAISLGDLLFVSAGPGEFSTVNALCSVAKAAGARVLLVTAQPLGSASQLADALALLPAQTMADDVAAVTIGEAGGSAPTELSPPPPAAATGSILPMGSLYEGALFVLFEMVILKLRDALGETPDSMRARHTNLE